MAISPSHRFGQIIGEVLEATILPLLAEFANKHSLYLDKKGHRPCRRGVKCAWIDLNGNTHDLDYVLERAGTDYERGTPVAFIETAWRRYTKHSRNKAQEIQGAIEPLAQTFRHVLPFKGAVLAGVFTEGALTQLQSLGFTVLFFPYEMIISAFHAVNINAFFDEDTPDAECQRKVDLWKSLPLSDRDTVSRALLDQNQGEVKRFMDSLTSAVARQIERIIILPLHGMSYETTTIGEAIKIINKHNENSPQYQFIRYEIQVKFNDGDEATGKFGSKFRAIEFLRQYQTS